MTSSLLFQPLRMNITSAFRRRGLVNLPGISHASKSLVESLLAKDAHEHHCYFTPTGLHNHLSHHLIAAYDLGAPAGLLQNIYDSWTKLLRPIFVEEKDKEIIISKENWKQHLGDQHAYGAYFKFFSTCVSELGVLKTIEKYVFAPEANTDDAQMLNRLVSGLLHPLINLGYGLEFGSDIMVPTSLAQTAIHPTLPASIFDMSETTGIKTPSRRGPSVLEILGEVYESDILKPVMPYDPNALISARIRDALTEERVEEIRRLCSQYVVDASLGEEEFQAKVDEIIWTTTLLLSASGRPGRKPRLDFFLMHLVTSSLFLPSFFSVLQNPIHKANLLRMYLPCLILTILMRGRPRINPGLLMSYTPTARPPPPYTLLPGAGAVGDPQKDADYNPWPAMLQTVLYAPEPHVVKAMRTLVYAATKYGDTAAGGAIGAYTAGDDSRETHKGMGEVDGTIFVRAAGMLVDCMGWTGHGGAPKEWDRSALGWDDAWNNEDD